jgi:hypothetical protein
MIDALNTNSYIKAVKVSHHDDHTAFTLTVDPYSESDSKLLGQAIEECARFGSNGQCNTVVVRVDMPYIPSFIEMAIEHLVGFGVALVVLHDNQSSLESKPTLPRSLLTAIGRAARDGQAWDPIGMKTVQMYPQSSF